jgi:hypothetical protein
MNTTYELNNLRKDADMFSGKFTKNSPVVEIFSAMVNGEEVSKFGAKADKAVAYIKELGSRSENGDPVAISELNTLRRFAIETPVMQELKLLGIFGSYQHVGYDETIEREIYTHSGERSREQAASGDVVFPVTTKERYTVPTYTVSGGYAVDYRRVALGDMSKENEGINQVKIDIRNRALLSIVNRIYKALQDATGVKFMVEEAGLTKTAIDDVLTKVRRMGKPTVIGDYALISQFTPWAGYVGNVNSNTITGVSEKVMNELAANGALSQYNGAILSEMPNPYDLYNLNEAGDNFKTLLPAGLGFVIPTGAQSPIATYSRGGLTSFTGNNVKNGKIETRFDLEIGCDIAKGQEYKIGVIYDTNVGGLAV